MKRHVPVPSRQMLHAGVWILGVSAVALLVAMLAAIVRLSNDYSDLKHDATTSDAAREELRTDLDAQERALIEANRRLRNAGKPPVSTPPATTEPEPGTPGATGASCVEEYGLALCRGPRGAQGIRGRTGSTGADGDTITGPRGIPGESITGPPGPPGPAGPAGPPGKDGANGTNGANGKDGTTTPGTYACPDGQYVAGFTVDAGGLVTLDCRTPSTLPNGGPQ